jgi:hypothetical protein
MTEPFLHIMMRYDLFSRIGNTIKQSDGIAIIEIRQLKKTATTEYLYKCGRTL